MCINYPGITARRIQPKNFAQETKSVNKTIGAACSKTHDRVRNHPCVAAASSTGASGFCTSEWLAAAFHPTATATAMSDAVCGNSDDSSDTTLSSFLLQPPRIDSPDTTSVPVLGRLARQVKLEPTADKSTFLLATTNTTAPVPQSATDDSKKRARNACCGTKRKVLKPGCTAKNHIRHFVQHNYHDYSHDTVDTIVESIRRRTSTEGPDQASTDDDDAPHQHAQEEHEETGEEYTSSKRTKKPRKGPRGGVATPFPVKLYEMLESVEKEGDSHIVSWQPHGRCFAVHKPKDFVATIMPKYFRQSKITSFQRQLNLYGFARLTYGADRGGYYHEMFLRGRPFLAARMVRVRVKGTGIKAASSPASEPDFYSMPSVEPLDDCLGGAEEDESKEETTSKKTESIAPTPSTLPCTSPPTESPVSTAVRLELPLEPANNEPSGSILELAWTAPPAPLQKPQLVSPRQQQSQQPIVTTEQMGMDSLVPVPVEQYTPHCEGLNQLDAVLNPPVNFEGQKFYCLEEEKSLHEGMPGENVENLVEVESTVVDEGTTLPQAVKTEGDRGEAEDMDEFFCEFLKNAEMVDAEMTGSHAQIESGCNHEDDLAQDEYFQNVLMSLCSE